MSIDVSGFGYTPVKPDDTFNFHCACCGDCCRNVKSAVMVESLDMFRLARFMKMDVKDLVLQYMDMAFLAWCYPIFMLKTRPHMDTCVFLEKSKCSVHDAKPRTCRTYPLGTGPDDESKDMFQYFIVSKMPRHFSGPDVRVKDWMAANFTEEDRAFVAADYAMTGELAKLLPKIDSRFEKLVIYHMLFFRYINFDTTKEFQEQYIRNMVSLKFELSRLVAAK